MLQVEAAIAGRNVAASRLSRQDIEGHPVNSDEFRPIFRT